MTGETPNTSAAQPARRQNPNQRRYYQNRGPRPHYRRQGPRRQQQPQPAENERDQKAMLQEALDSENHECLVCCAKIRRPVAVWSCNICFQVMHLFCVKKWATAAMQGEVGTWPCPGCRNPFSSLPRNYVCFCGRRRDPSPRSHSAHSCGDSCARPRSCPHPCPLRCHPGPCPPCQAVVRSTCLCLKEERPPLPCHRVEEFCCEQGCQKRLECGHMCEAGCHAAACPPCTRVVEKVCPCGQHRQMLACSTPVLGSCGAPCPHKLPCDHPCPLRCHEGSCPVCPRSLITHCPCGRNVLPPRSSCKDPVICCGAVCDKPRPCGHPCKEKCHEGDCPPCTLSGKRKCRCGRSDVSVPCQSDQVPVCQKRCQASFECGRHKCQQTCCDFTEHICLRPCGRRLTCGLHRCDMPCHRGQCPRCTNTSFEELRCACGSEVIEPPVPCGTAPPACRRQCIRVRPCGHDTFHECHIEDECPPCAVLELQPCHGGHETRHLPCHIKDYSCGLKCGQLKPCGHNCDRPCHKDPCESKPCQLPCPVERGCGHPCSMPCHGDAECPPSSCPHKVTTHCPCGRLSESRPCSIGATLYRAMRNMTVEESLPCDDECRRLERNRKLAEALGVQPRPAQPPPVPYTDLVKEWARTRAHFAQDVERQLIELVKRAHSSHRPSESYAFKCMRREERHFVHDLAEAFHIQTASYDEEPRKNVVATAKRGVSVVPEPRLAQLGRVAP